MEKEQADVANDLRDRELIGVHSDAVVCRAAVRGGGRYAAEEEEAVVVEEDATPLKRKRRKPPPPVVAEAVLPVDVVDGERRAPRSR